MSIAVITRSYDNTRSGANTSETTLSPSAIRSRGDTASFFAGASGRRARLRGPSAHRPGVKLQERRRHDIAYVATMANQVFAFDANTGAKLWMVQLGTPINGSRGHRCAPINDHWGILSTPVIDAADLPDVRLCLDQPR